MILNKFPAPIKTPRSSYPSIVITWRLFSNVLYIRYASDFSFRADSLESAAGPVLEFFVFKMITSPEAGTELTKAAFNPVRLPISDESNSAETFDFGETIEKLLIMISWAPEETEHRASKTTDARYLE